MIAIEVKHLSKAYKLYQSPAQRLKEIILRKPFHTQFIAIQNINFSVLHGETFGIIGENGAGKSTLLKILARTLKPSEGEVIINGRTSALLELGAGFNPELTGEENLYLNAYLMGLSRKEIDEKKQEIIDFSELGDFIGRPVKTYSSGMYVRLAFSIATTVNPDILIIDEALSVGDEHFQKKCIDRMIAFRESGKTILFCSHSMYHIQELCNKAMWIHKGQVKNMGDTGKIIMDYQNYERGKSGVMKENISDSAMVSGDSAGKPVRIFDAKVIDKNGAEASIVYPLDPVVLSFRIRCNRNDIRGHLGFGIIRNDEVTVFGTLTNFDGFSPISFEDGQEVQVKIGSLPLLPGLYSVTIVVADEHAMHPYDILRTRNFQVVNRKEIGMTYIAHEWII